ncbi:MAG: Ycf48-like protein precursor [Mucilaginibacter sp.]|nr:Ycf48-like protein precursor [Mucilaginibacter sp.]
MRNIFTIFAAVLSVLFTSNIKAQTIIPVEQGKPTSIRGLSVVNDNVAWVSGSKGHIAITRDGGKTWSWQQVNGFENADFRDIEALSDKEAMVMSSGTPALILKTVDGGASWQVKYRNNDTAFFLDAMDFFGRSEGWILGDPINGKFLLLLTSNGGNTWMPYNSTPAALPGEAAFAASGTCLLTSGHSLLIVTGGSSSNLHTANYYNKNWRTTPLPLKQGKSSQGAFSIATNRKSLVVVGGNYQYDKQPDSTACYSTDWGLTWHLSGTPPAGFQSCVEHIWRETFVSTGTPGSNITLDGGKTWKKIDDTSYNVCRKAKRGKLVLFAGNGGKIGILKM